MNKKHLLIISCAMTKRADEGLMPAYRRYDGPLNKALRSRFIFHEDSPIDTWIVSAKFGLIHYDEEIEDYDMYMSPVRAMQLRDQVEKGLQELLRSDKYEDAYENLGSNYKPATGSAFVNSPIPIGHASGGIGIRMGMVCNWVDKIM